MSTGELSSNTETKYVATYSHNRRLHPSHLRLHSRPLVSSLIATVTARATSAPGEWRAAHLDARSPPELPHTAQPTPPRALTVPSASPHALRGAPAPAAPTLAASRAQRRPSRLEARLQVAAAAATTASSCCPIRPRRAKGLLMGRASRPYVRCRVEVSGCGHVKWGCLTHTSRLHACGNSL